MTARGRRTNIGLHVTMLADRITEEKRMVQFGIDVTTIRAGVAA